MPHLMSRVAVVMAPPRAVPAVIVPPAVHAERGLQLTAIEPSGFVTGGDVLIRVGIPAGMAAGSVRVRNPM
jgi:hypothetical protein